MKAKQIITYIIKNNQLLVDEIKHSREETLNIMRELVLQMDNHARETRILENRHAKIDREEYFIQLATSST
jgi:hypoxanthine phosphoribosyltransferase